MSLNILITSAGHKTNLVRYFRRALTHEGGGKLYLSDCSSGSRARHFADGLLISPSVDKGDAFCQWLLAAVKQYAIRCIVPSRDGDLRQLSELKETLWNDFQCHVLVPGKSTVALCLNKRDFYHWCAENGYQTAGCDSVATARPSQFPVFVKPCVGSGSQGAQILNSVQEWDAFCATLPEALSSDYLVQSYVDGVEYTVDCFVNMAGTPVSIVPRERVQTLSGESVEAKIHMDNALIAVATRLVEQLQLTGQSTIQLFKVDDIVIVSEVNPRFGGGFTLSVEAGADTPRYVIRELMEKAIEHDVTQLDTDLQMVRVQKDVFIRNELTQPREQKTYCVDLDGTLCTESCPYEEAQPIALTIDKVNRLYHQGHRILIHTARGAASGRDWRPLVESQLAAWSVQYHALVMGKPYADFYIDNKAVDVLEWV